MGRKLKTVIATDNCTGCGGYNSIGYVVGKDGRLYGNCDCGCKIVLNEKQSLENIEKCKRAGIDVDNIFLAENHFNITETNIYKTVDKEINSNGDNATINIK